MDDTERLGREADMVMQTEVYQRAMKSLVDDEIDRWKLGTYDTPDAREQAFWRVRAAIGFQENVQHYLNSFKIAAANAKARQR